MRVIIYIRVSTKLQETKFSLAAQQLELTKYANEQNWEIVATYKDVDSGGKLDKEGLNRLLDDIEDGKVDVVLVADQDRLSRLDTVEWEFLKDILRKNDVKIAEPGRITDLKNEDDEFFSDLKNLIAQREKKSVVRRMMRGKKQRMREGKGFGRPPLGYKFNKESKEYEIDSEWSWVIPLIDKLYLEKEMGMKSIADELNKISKTPSGRLWNETLVHRRLISKAFHGVMEKKFSTGEIISIENAYPPLRTKEIYELIQEERKKRGSVYKVNNRQKELHIFRRTEIVCGLCGRKINLEQHGTAKTPRYYLKHGRKVKISDRSKCDIVINTIRVENNAIKVLKDILTSEETANKYISFEKNEEAIKNLKQAYESLEKKVKKNEIKLDRLLELYLDGEFDRPTLIAKQDSIKSELTKQNEELSKLQNQLKIAKSQVLNYDMLYEFFGLAQQFEMELSPVEQAKIFSRIFSRAILYQDRMTLITELTGVPININIKVEDDPFTWHSTKKNKQ